MEEDAVDQARTLVALLEFDVADRQARLDQLQKEGCEPHAERLELENLQQQLISARRVVAELTRALAE